MCDEPLLMRVELALEGAQIAAIDGAAEGLKVRQLVLTEQRRRGEDAEDQPHL